MRLWHTKLIDVLPKQQMSGQWRELNSIFRNKNRHILINFVYDSPKDDLYWYSNKVLDEMKRRGYKYNVTNMVLYSVYEANSGKIKENPFPEKMDDEYLTICYFNLLEKFRCGGIPESEWKKIDERARRSVYEWVGNNLKPTDDNKVQ